ncbi:MAG: hypothetical protein J3K34DRAFT_520807 [Monoraphidium minutum]|nr:MAG: hypothetical protein J3K34DRAFT_520807 [Monoraphidium minutum]
MNTAVADFGLSWALLAGQTHETTRHYGTVTSQPPELLARGVLSPAGDVMGILLWGLVHAGQRPFGDMLHGEIINRVIHHGMWPTFAPDTWEPYVKLSEDCWQLDAAQRPTMPQLVARIDALIALAEAEAARAQPEVGVGSLQSEEPPARPRAAAAAAPSGSAPRVRRMSGVLEGNEFASAAGAGGAPPATGGAAPSAGAGGRAAEGAGSRGRVSKSEGSWAMGRGSAAAPAAPAAPPPAAAPSTPGAGPAVPPAATAGGAPRGAGAPRGWRVTVHTAPPQQE